MSTKIDNGKVKIEVCGEIIEIEVRNGKFIKPKELLQVVGRGSALKPAHEPIFVAGKSDQEVQAQRLPSNPLYYTAKAGSKERNFGCENLFWLRGDDGSLKEISKAEYDAAFKNNEDHKQDTGYVAIPISQGNIWPCLHPDSFVLTSEGMVRIADVNIGDSVYSHDGTYHRVTDKFEKPCPVLYRIKVSGCNVETLASNNHPFLIYRPTRSKKGNIRSYDISWQQAEDVQVGDYTMTPISKMGKSKAKLGENLAFILGLWLAEGSLLKAGHGNNIYPVWTFSNTEKHFVDIIKSISKCRVSIYNKKAEDSFSVIAFDPALGKMCLKLCGKMSWGKRLSSSVFSLSDNERKKFLEGYLAGDGSKCKGEICAKTVSDKLAYQLKILGESVGYYVSCDLRNCKTKGIGGRMFKNVRPYWTVRFANKNVDGSGKHCSKPTLVTWNDVTYTIQRVKESTRLNYDGNVVNLTVEGTHTFQTSVGMSHNTVKPLELMRYLVKLCKMPAGNLILDPFLGSGTTACACVMEGCDFVGIDRDPVAVRIANERIKYWASQATNEKKNAQPELPL
jgi:hypothetical protein